MCIFRNQSLAGLCQPLSNHYQLLQDPSNAMVRVKFKKNLGQDTLAVNILFKLAIQEKYQLLIATAKTLFTV